MEETDVSPNDTPLGRTTDWAGLALAGLLSAVGYAALAFIPTSNRASHVLFYLTLMAILFGIYGWVLAIAGRSESPAASRRVFLVAFGFSVLFRLLMLPVGLPTSAVLQAAGDDLAGRGAAVEPFLLYDNDVWRYLWDGHVLAEGTNPYSVTPADVREDTELGPALLANAPWPDVLDNVSYQNYTSVYPPLTQYVFATLAIAAPGSVLAAKAVLITLDLLLIALLWAALRSAGRSPLWSLAYAWNPAVVKELTGSAHPDIVMMLPMTLAVILVARSRSAFAAVALGAATLAKVTPILLLPLFVRRRAGLALALFAGALLTGILPLWSGLADWWDGIRRFAAGWTFNSGPWSSMAWVAERLGSNDPGLWANLLALAAVGIIAAIAWRSTRTGDAGSFHSAAFVTLAALVVFRPAVMPWYTLWPLPLAVLSGNRSWLVFTGLAQLSYLSFVEPAWPTWWKWIEYGIFFLLLWTQRSHLTDGTSTPRLGSYWR